MSENTTHPEFVSAYPIGEDSVGYDPTTDTYHARFDRDPETIVVTIVETVASVTDRDPMAMPPLFETIDPESLASIVTSTRENQVQVEFPYEDCKVTVSSHGEIVVEPPSEEA